MFCDLGETLPLNVVQYFTIVALARHVDAEDDCLIHHLVKMNSSTDVLGDLRLSIDEKVPRNVHQFDERRKILLDRSMIHNYESSALLRGYPLVGIIETRKRTNRSSSQAGNSGRKYPGKPDPNRNIAR